MANKLEIEVVADTDAAAKGILEVEHSLEQLDKSAAKSGDEGAASANKWSSALDGVKQKASDLGSTIKTQAKEATSGFTEAFGGLGLKLSTIGATAGRMFGTALRTAALAAATAGGAAIAAALFSAIKDMPALDRLMQAFGKLGDALKSVLGLGGEGGAAFDAINSAIESLAIGIEGLAEAIPAIATAMANFGNTTLDVLRKIDEVFRAIVDTTVEFIGAGWDGVVASITAIGAAFDAVIGFVTTLIAKVKELVAALGRVTGVSWLMNQFGGGGAQSAPQGIPMPMMAPAGLMAAPQQSNLVGRRALGAPAAAGSTPMDAMVTTLDRLVPQVEAFANASVDAASATEKLGAAATSTNTDLDAMGNLAQQVADDFASWGENAVTSFADAAIEGRDLHEVLQQLIKDLAKMALQWALKPLFGALGGGGGGLFAAPAAIPMSAQPQTMTGLLGAPEPLTGLSNLMGRQSASLPDARGTTVNNNVGDIGIDMSQTGVVAASTEDGKKLGQQIQRAVEAILVKESRPGGLLRTTGAR